MRDPPNALCGWPRAALSSGDRRRCDGAAAASGPGRRAPPAWMPSPTCCSRCWPCSARAPGCGAPEQRNATTANPQGVTFAISDDAAQRAFPSELLVARAIGLSAARAYVDWSAIAPQRPAQPRNPADPGLRLEAARRRRGALPRAPAWPCRSRSGACRPGPTAARRRTRGRSRPRISATSPTPSRCATRRCGSTTTGTSRTRACSPSPTRSRPTSRWRARSTRPCTPPTRPPRSSPATSRATATRAATRPCGPRACAPTACRWTTSASTRTRCGERRSRCATRSTASTCSTCPRSRAAPGVPVVVSEFGWSSDDAGLDQQAAWTAEAIAGRPLHARPRRASSSGASTTIRCRSAPRRIRGCASAGSTPPDSPSPSSTRPSTPCASRSTARRSPRRPARPPGWPLLSTIPFPDS